MSRINQCYYAPGIAKRTKPSSVQKVQKVQKGWRGGLQSDRQSHRLVITRSRLTKPHDSAVSHEPPYMCAEATLIAFVIAQRPHAEDGAPLVMRAHLALPHPCGVRPWLLLRHHNTKFLFFSCLLSLFFIFFMPRSRFQSWVPPNVRVAAPTVAVEAGGGKKV